MPVNETKYQQPCVLITLHQNNVCNNCSQLTGMLGTVVLDHKVCLFKLHADSVHVCSIFTRPAIITIGSADIFTITHVRLCRTGPVYMSETKHFSVTAT